MKKFITLALVLVMALSLAAPALAFTNVEYDPDSDTPIELSAKIVDVAEGYVSVNFTAAPTNRGYVKNEVVCMVATMYVPKDVDPSDDFDKLAFSGTNVSVWQDENFMPQGYGFGTVTSSGGGRGMLNYLSKNAYNAFINGGNRQPFYYADDMATDNEIYTEDIDDLYNKSSNQTYHFAIFGKVTADGAYMNVALKGSFELTNGGDPQLGDPQSVQGGDYYVLYWNNNKDNLTTSAFEALNSSRDDFNQLDLGDKKVAYVVYAKDKVTPKFAIVTGKDFTCEEMWVYENGTWYEIVGVIKDGFKVSGFEKGIRIYYNDGTDDLELTENNTATAAEWTAVLKTVRGVIRDDFKLDPTISGQMKPVWWRSNNELFVEVAIQPWYAEVTVPPEIQIDPPKTGDAMNILGFVLIALAGLAVVAVRKVRA